MKKFFCLLIAIWLLAIPTNSVLSKASATDFSKSLYCDIDLPFCYGVV